MIKQLLLATAVFATVGAQAQQLSYNERARQYIAKYKDWALEEQRRSGVPAAITLAQGIFETSAGNSELATQANNHFGIKCRKEWTGETFAHDDDAPQECFRKYADARQSYKDHSDYLKTSKRYASCFAQDVNDYKSWARELKRCGYATNPKYAPQLVKIVEDFNLQEHTLAAASGAVAPVLMASAGNPAAAVVMAEKQEKAATAATPEHDTPAPNTAIVYGQATKKDGLRGFYAKKGDVLLEYAIQYKLRYARLLEMNGLPDAPLEQDQFIYLERGMRVTQLMAHDASVPAPVVASTNVPVTAPPVYRPAEKVSTPVAASTPVPAPVEDKPAPAAVAVNTGAQNQDYLRIAQPAGEVEASAEKPVNIANETAVEEEDDDEEKAAPVAANAPKSDFDRLKARFDRVVYEPAKKTAPAASAAAPSVAAAPPAPGSTQVAAPAAALSNGRQFHTVKSGETAFGIARQYGITMKQLMDMNSLNFEAIRIGQKLRVK
jgi:LysM repeat protein